MRLGVATRVALLVGANVAIGAWVVLTAREPSDPPATQYDIQAQLGHNAWRASGCASCHALFGLGGHAGPDLTNVMRRRGRAYVDAAMTYGVGRMPAQPLGAERRAAIGAFLAHVDSLATYPIPSLTAGAFGAAAGAPQQRELESAP